MFLFDGLIATRQPAPVFAMFGSSLLGVLIGAVPGLNPVMAIALLLPLTYSMDPLVALGMASVGVMVGDDAVKGLLASLLGLLLGTVGIDNLSGTARSTFDQPWLLGGLDLIVLLVGLYALPPVPSLAEKADLEGLSAASLWLARVRFGWADVRALVPT